MLTFACVCYRFCFNYVSLYATIFFSFSIEISFYPWNEIRWNFTLFIAMIAQPDEWRKKNLNSSVTLPDKNHCQMKWEIANIYRMKRAQAGSPLFTNIAADWRDARIIFTVPTTRVFFCHCWKDIATSNLPFGDSFLACSEQFCCRCTFRLQV